MLELLTMMSSMQSSLDNQSIESFENNKENINFVEGDIHRIPTSWIVLSILIGIGTAYLAYSCNLNETPATRLIITLFAFFFSGIYLVYYFILYILLNKKCNGKDISDIIKKILKK
jgi:hypothetical protein